ncbi:MAG: hypothetical protein K6T34_08035 [Thermoflavifilum sp.]|nr:hypothetical protein [Thermoflavifilum sp.]
MRISSLLLILMFWGCHSTQQSSGPKRLATNFEELLALFPNRALPYQINPDSLNMSIPDSVAFLPEVVSQFFPDSIWRSSYSHGQVKVFPIAAIAYQNGHFLIIRVQQGQKAVAFLCYFDRKHHFHQALRLTYIGPDWQADRYDAKIDKRGIITLDQHIHTSDQRSILRERVYALNPEGNFLLVLTNANGALPLEEVYNPIDTLPARHPFSGDYVKGDLSIVSIRDGENKQTFRFFIHFYDPKTQCGGELQGIGHFMNRSTGTFKDDQGPCAIDFHFSAHQLRIEEVGGCGAYRGIQCFFNGTYFRKKMHAHSTKAQ